MSTQAELELKKELAEAELRLQEAIQQGQAAFRAQQKTIDGTVKSRAALIRQTNQIKKAQDNYTRMRTQRELLKV